MITYNNLPVFELKAEDEEMGVFAISLVDRPATETQWLAFAEEIKFSLDSDKQIISAPLMLANTPIYRNDNINGEHYIVFTPATLEKMSINFFKNNVREFNEMHNSAFGINNATVVESWIKTSESDKSVALGFKDVPVGSWMISVFIDDKQYWEENIKSGKFKGFSLEGFFEKVQLSAQDQTEGVNEGVNDGVNDGLNDFVNKLNDIAKSDLSNKELIAELKNMLFVSENFEDTYNDYPQQAVDNAKKGIELNEAVDNDCATAVGKIRAQDIANKRGLSFDVIKRTFSYLSRAEEFYNPEDEKACGTISYLLWGGKSMKSWCEQKINEIENEKSL